MIKINFTVNCQNYILDVDENLRLIDILRDILGLKGTKESCSIGECGVCTVIMNDLAVNSCLILACQVDGAKVETIENIEKNHVISTIQQSFLENGAIQCGFCTPGMIMSVKALLNKNPTPSVDDIKTALEGNLCRCTGYIPILDALKSSIPK
jgi:carbon-monoxide dehydrogenase small subunit